MSRRLELVTAVLVLIGATLVIVRTHEPWTIGLWGLTVFATGASGRQQVWSWPFYLWLALGLFYPVASDRFSSVNEYATIDGVALCLMALLAPRVLAFLGARNRTAALLALVWAGWGVLVYAPVFVGWLIQTTGHAAPAVLKGLAIETSALKTAVPVIAAWTPIIGALAAIRSASDARAFFGFLVGTVIVLALLSVAQVATGGFTQHWIPVTYSILPSRLHSVSSPDPNGTARQLLLPLLIVLSAGILAPPGTSRRMVAIAVLLGGGCLIATQSRTGVLSLSAGLATIVLADIRKRRTLRWLAVSVAAALIGVLAIVALGIIGGERLTLSNVAGRFELYEALGRVMSEHLIFGVRPGGYIAALRDAGYPTIIGTHNMWFGVAVEWGWPMALLLLAVLACTIAIAAIGLNHLRRYRRTTAGWYESRALLVAGAALAVALAVHGLSESVPPELPFLALGLALAARYQLIPAVRAAATEAVHP